MKRTDRLMSIILLLRSRKKLSARQLAEEFEVTRRTIYRDISSLCQARIPIAVESGPEGGYSILDTYSLPPTTFTREEAIALFLGGHFINHLQGTPFREAMKTALIKIEDILSENLRESVQLLSQSILLNMENRSNDSATGVIFERIHEAIVTRRCIDLAYHNTLKNQTHRRLVRPYGLVYDKGIWHLIGACHVNATQQIFHLNCIQKAILTNQDFDMPEMFNLRNLARSLTEWICCSE